MSSSNCRSSHRLAEIAVGLALVLLLALLVVLCTGSSGTGSSSSSKLPLTAGGKAVVAVGGDNATTLSGQPVLGRDLLQAQERPGDEAPQNVRVTDPPSTRRDSAFESSTVSGAASESEDTTWSHWKGDILPAGGAGESELIVLAKANQNTYEDPLDEQTRAERHHSGHFRHSQSRVWDPHPQYEFTAFGRKLHLRLGEDSGFATRSSTVTHIGTNASRHEYLDQHLGCFYSGYVEGDPKSVVTVSLCHGMTGYVHTSTGNYLIKPTERWSSVDNSSSSGGSNVSGPVVGSPLQHVIYRLSKSDFGARNPAANRTANDLPGVDDVHTGCGVTDNESRTIAIDDVTDTMGASMYVADQHQQQHDEGSAPAQRRRRRRRQVDYPAPRRDPDDDDDEDNDDRYGEEGVRSSHALEDDIYGSWRTRRALPREYFIEIMVVADAKMIDYHRASLTSYVLVLMNEAAKVLKNPTIGNPIAVAVVQILQVDEMFGERKPRVDGIDASDMLGEFCKWQAAHNPAEPSPHHSDIALLLTRETICRSDDSCDTLGYTEIGGMCKPHSSCAIVQDNGLATAFTIAHEIGHMLGMLHDNDSRCMRLNPSGITNIMASSLADNTVPWEWSKCSRQYVTDFFDRNMGSCLLDAPEDDDSLPRRARAGGRLPGEEYPGNRQCELVYGNGSEICPHMMSNVCRKLWCTQPALYGSSEQCHTQHMPWADGTVCGPNKWCHRSECVSRERDLQSVDGQWSEWGPYGECSRSCGGGIKKKYRHCNNPAPQNDGKYCVGERVRYRSCGTRDCPPGSPDFRDQLCAAYDNDNRDIPNLSRNVKWRAKYLPKPSCKLHCRTPSGQYYPLENKVVDGTPCGLDTFDVCVNGLCKPAGCDHQLNSRAELDACGVCRGDNTTCQKIFGSFNSSDTMLGYNTITEIPAGSSHIDVRQYGWKSQNDSNYLVLQIKESGKYILNGNRTVMPRKVITFPGVTVEYSGPSKIERVNATKPISVTLVLQVLSAGKLDPPQIMYEYTVPKHILNRQTSWVVSDWTTCDRTCQGTSYRRAVCRDVETKDILHDDYCAVARKPHEEKRSCNTNCRFEWREIPNSRTECSSHCGPGTLYVKFRCVQVLLGRSNVPARPVLPHLCNEQQRPAERQACVGPCEYAHWRYGEWSPCSVSCGDKGVQVRSASCVDADNRRLPEDKCPAEGKIVNKSCEYKPCPKWELGDWSQCSVTCGIGTRERAYWCHIDNRVVHRSRCGSEPTDVRETCDAGPCGSWQTGDWSSCSVTCGDGVRRRMVACTFANGSVSQDCDITAKPINTISCGLASCPIKVTFAPVTYSSNLPADDLAQHENDVDSNRITFRSGYTWEVQGYEECSKSCGGGIARQIIKCMSVETGEEAPNEDYCDARTKPRDTVVCNKHNCPTWSTGGWSQCDVKCGEGYQHRPVLCQDSRGEIINDSDCSEETRPGHARKCQRVPCVHNKNYYDSHNVASYKWRAGAWGECSVSCGNGVRRRDVTCHRLNSYGWLDPSPTSGCPQHEKPASSQFCKIRGCSDPFYWEAGPWRKCSQQCGRKAGRQVRRLFCLDQRGHKVRRKHCPPGLRPQRKRRCNQRPCTGPTSCLEAQTRLKAYDDGEYQLLVAGRYMSIYCHEMRSREPREYLTLQAEHENYAEIYDKRLRDPNTCPYDGRRNDSCECMADTTQISGRTMFRKVRLSVHTLHIIADDYTFAVKIGENNIEYGKAGDCYSQLDCPQGRFGINLSNTYLMLAPDVHWPQQKNSYSVIEKTNNQQIVGKCGGYCGFCTPSPGLKLNVLPP